METIFTAQQLKGKGFRVSEQVSQAEIDRAVTDAFVCYVGKVSQISIDQDGRILHTAAQAEAAMQIAYILLLNRHAVATRSGGKTKESPQLSQNAYASQGDIENADRLLRKVQTVDGLPSKLVDDIAGIYYRNVFMAL